jgi:hypothetical protein
MKHRLVLTTAELHALRDYLTELLPSLRWPSAAINPYNYVYYWMLSDLEVRLYRRIRSALPLTTRKHSIALNPATAITLWAILSREPEEHLSGHHWATELNTYVHAISQ